MTYKSKISILNAPVGTVFYRVANSAEMNICDVCGCRKKCDWYECEDLWIITGFDCCRTCSKEALEEIE